MLHVRACMDACNCTHIPIVAMGVHVLVPSVIPSLLINFVPTGETALSHHRLLIYGAALMLVQQKVCNKQTHEYTRHTLGCNSYICCIFSYIICLRATGP